MSLALTVAVERWPLMGTFSLARGTKTEALVVVAELADGPHRGRGECVPYARYGETVAGVAAAIEAMRAPLAAGLDRLGLQARMPAGAARNALDCAFWDLEAKRTDRRAHALAGLPPPQPLDQPCAEGIEFRDLRDIDGDIRPGTRQLFGVGDDRFEQRREARGP